MRLGWRRQQPELAVAAGAEPDELLTGYAARADLPDVMDSFEPRVERRLPTDYVCLAFPESQVDGGRPDRHYGAAIAALNIQTHLSSAAKEAWDDRREKIGLALHSHMLTALVDPLREHAVGAGSNVGVLLATEMINPHSRPPLDSYLWSRAKLAEMFKLGQAKRGLSPVPTYDRMSDMLAFTDPEAVVTYCREAVANAVNRDLAKYGVRVTSDTPDLAKYGYLKLVEQSDALRHYREKHLPNSADRVYLERFANACLEDGGVSVDEAKKKMGAFMAEQFGAAIELLAGRQPVAAYSQTSREAAPVTTVVRPGAEMGAGNVALRGEAAVEPITGTDTKYEPDRSELPSTQMRLLSDYYLRLLVDCTEAKRMTAEQRERKKIELARRVDEMHEDWSARENLHPILYVYIERESTDYIGALRARDPAKAMQYFGDESVLGELRLGTWAALTLSQYGDRRGDLSKQAYQTAKARFYNGVMPLLHRLQIARRYQSALTENAKELRQLAVGVDIREAVTDSSELRAAVAVLRGINIDDGRSGWMTLIAADIVNDSKHSLCADKPIYGDQMRARANAALLHRVHDEFKISPDGYSEPVRKLLIECVVLRDHDFANQPDAIKTMLARRMHKMIPSGNRHRELPPAARRYYDMYAAHYAEHK